MNTAVSPSHAPQLRREPLPETAPYGSWKSPITPDLMVSDKIGLDRIVLDGPDTYWIESRPSEGGRNVVVRRGSDGEIGDVTPPEFNVCTRVHEYGGGAYAVDDGTVYFSNFGDQRVYRHDPGSAPEALTPPGDLRYADHVVDQRRGRIICVREDHTTDASEAVNSLVGVPIDGDAVEALVSGADFYSTPRLSPDGSRLAWLSWDHPNMPWDGTELWTGVLDDTGNVARSRKVAGGQEESVFQPAWSPDGVLHFVSDRYGWWNLYRLREESVEPLWELEAEFGAPQWGLGMSTYGFAEPNQIVCAYVRQGSWSLATLDTAQGQLEVVDTGYSDISAVTVASGSAVFRGASPTEGPAVVGVDLDSGRLEVLSRAREDAVAVEYLSKPEAIEFPTENGLTAHAFLYRPTNRDFVGPTDERPPLLVKSHGGPTGATTNGLSMLVQYWTSRGIAVLDVNYGGSTGFGTEYRRRLDGQWGIVDVDDCVNGARYLVGRGDVDGERLAIDGGSAGGYTTLCALTFRDTFRAGASYYGICDLEALARDTHKFESRYFDRMVVPYPERRDVWVERSPIHFTDRLSCPVVLFQGLEDKIVPPNQAEMMADALRAKGLPVALVLFEGEQHGFRRAESIRRSLEGELYFYSRVFGFPLADPVEPLPIENL